MLTLKIFSTNDSWNDGKYLTNDKDLKFLTFIYWKHLLIVHYIIDLMFFFLFSDRHVFVNEFKSYQH